MTNKLTNKEPSNEEIEKYAKANKVDLYTAREKLREQAYGGKPPFGFQSWGDYWKSY